MSRYFNDWYFGSGQSDLDEHPEEFRSIPDFPEEYSIHPDGYYAKGDKIIQSYNIGKRGYKEIKVYRDGKVTRNYLHRALAEVFIPNPDNLPIVRHLNDDGSDNRVDNLAWGTVKDNYNDSVANGGYAPLSTESRKKAIESTRTPIIVTSPSGEELYFKSQRDACRELSLSPECVCLAAKGKIKQTGGYRIRRAENE